MGRYTTNQSWWVPLIQYATGESRMIQGGQTKVGSCRTGGEGLAIGRGPATREAQGLCPSAQGLCWMLQVHVGAGIIPKMMNWDCVNCKANLRVEFERKTWDNSLFYCYLPMTPLWSNLAVGADVILLHSDDFLMNNGLNNFLVCCGGSISIHTEPRSRHWPRGQVEHWPREESSSVGLGITASNGTAVLACACSAALAQLDQCWA